MKDFFAVSLAFCAAFTMAAQNVTFTDAPAGDLSVAVEAHPNVYRPIKATVKLGPESLIDISALGLKTSARDFSDLRLIEVSEPSQSEEQYHMVTGKRHECYNVSTDRTYTFANSKGERINVDMRVFPDGLAFRYRIPAGKAGECVEDEYTTYFIPDGTKRWIQPYSLVYEDFYPLATTGADINRNQEHRWGYPALIEPVDSRFVLISESDIQRGHAGSLLSNASDPTKYEVMYGGGLQDIGPEGWTSPWRVVMAGDLADIVQSTLITDVAAPAVTDDVDWIKPAPVSWIYWANNHGSNDLDILKTYVDLAVDMHWPYMLIDAEWDEMKDGKDITDALNYAHQRGVVPMIWYNSSTGWIDGAPGPKFRLNTPADREKEYSWLNEVGVPGVKIDFFDGDKVQDMDYCIDLLEDALKHHIMVTLHGATIPRGWQRTYPNLMTVEAVYGAEWYNNKPVLTNRAAAHNATLPFTRNVIGPMDYTPGTFTDSQHPHITSHGHELALCFLFESPLQHMPDRPEAYASLPAEVRSLLMNLPTAWDDTALLSGYPGEYVVMARIDGDDIYVAGINGTDSSRILDFDLRGLLCDSDDYQMTLYTDGKSQREFGPVITAQLTDPKMAVPCLPRGGFVAVISPKN